MPQTTNRQLTLKKKSDMLLFINLRILPLILSLTLK
ncbi:hypothetical protein EHR_03410 [Enterococcus hirae ATCC 9790]|uniref:Uncharacterized protein n=1 Tax=Enterococcus hirae (strain ATCC 9790 / DSM 20160 / JCM 8729 / LMG 6399 / NBRC 3181 / NCIMB 6459 / NCDO 1258 / NCTC 12367 / WDCM 00089 / R) TaxID=768486 RepID=I6T8X9_ENTHA|nr:hypothetical protein EHR_03410 [Enterococcus hirae ATCC 9790]